VVSALSAYARMRMSCDVPSIRGVANIVDRLATVLLSKELLQIRAPHDDPIPAYTPDSDVRAVGRPRNAPSLVGNVPVALQLALSAIPHGDGKVLPHGGEDAQAARMGAEPVDGCVMSRCDLQRLRVIHHPSELRLLLDFFRPGVLCVIVVVVVVVAVRFRRRVAKNVAEVEGGARRK